MTDSGPDSGAMRAEIIAALPRLRRFCRGLTGHGEDGDDLMQSTVERALARAYQFETGSRVDAWMFRIARNLHIVERQYAVADDLALFMALARNDHDITIMRVFKCDLDGLAAINETEILFGSAEAFDGFSDDGFR